MADVFNIPYIMSFTIAACLIATIVVLIKDAKLMAKLWVIWVFAIILFVCDVITIRKYIAPDFLKRKNKDKRNKK